MTSLSRIVIILNIAGLSLVQLLEAWRPGSVAGIFSIGWLIGYAVVSSLVVAVLERRR